MAKIIPGILTNNEEIYSKRLRTAENATDLIQIDIVDGKFAPNTTIDIESVSKYPPSCQLEIQLMVISPKEYIEKMTSLDFIKRIIFPLEIDKNIFDLIYSVKKINKSVGISINPGTEIEKVFPYWDDIDVLLLMTGRPGFSGQKLGEDTYERIKKSKDLMKELPVEIDIGVNFENAGKLAEVGADFLVSTTALFESDDFLVAFQKLASLAKGET